MFNESIKIYKRSFDTESREWVVSKTPEQYSCHGEGVSANKMDNPHYQPDDLLAVVIPEVGLGIAPKDEAEYKDKRYTVIASKEGDWGIESSLNNTTLTLK